MAVIESWVRCDLKKPVQVQMLGGNLFSMDNQGNKIGVEVFDNGATASLSGTVSGNVIRADGATVAVSGTLSGNKAYIVLPQAAYAVPGIITIVIKLTSSSVITTLAAVTGIVYRSSTDTAVDPGTIIPSIETLIAEIDAAVASIPADYSALWTRLAPAFSTEKGYSAGQYVTYNSRLYRFTSQHTAGSWNANHVVSLNIGEELGNIRGITRSIAVPIPLNIGSHYKTNGTSVTMSGGVPQRESTSLGFSGAYFACNANDVFTISGTGGDEARLWAFIASDGTVLRKSVTNNTLDKKIIIAPPGSAFIIVNTSNILNSYKGFVADQSYKNVQNPINLFMPDLFCGSSESYVSNPVITDTGAILTATEGELKYATVAKKLKPNASYVFYSSKITTSGSGFIRVRESSDGGKTYPTGNDTILMSSEAVDNTEYRTEFTTTTGDCRFLFYITGSSGGTGNVEFYNLMLVEKGKDIGHFVPYVTARDDELRAISGKIRNITRDDIIQGSYNRDGSVSTNAIRIRLRDFIPVSSGDIIHFEPGTTTTGILCAFVNERMYIKETSWAYNGTSITVPFSSQLMILYRKSSGNLSITPADYDANTFIEYTDKKRSSDILFRCNYCESIPVAASSSSPYPMDYDDFIALYESIRNRVTTLYSDYSDLIPKPLTVTRTALQTLTSGNVVYQYTFTPAYPKKTVFILSGIHGDEYQSQFGLYFIMRMLFAETYAYPELDKIRNNVKFVVIPCANPDGFEANTRNNADGINILDCFSPSYSGEIPKEFVAITTVAAETTFDYFIDMHTDPYAPTNGCFGYSMTTQAFENNFNTLYEITNTFRDIVKREYNYETGYKINGEYAVVGRLLGGGSVGYMYRNYEKLGCLVEIGTNEKAGSALSFAPKGSSEIMMMAVDWFTNVIMRMYKNVFGEE